jgi:triphosphoribosyl-dephospho-CoA synthase
MTSILPSAIHRIDRSAWLASLAQQSLIAEAELTPKPGLVDRRGSGVHPDLSLAMMRRSALAIEPYFREMALLCERGRPSQTVREQLAAIGRNAERAMLMATGGSNSHKGAIWILGLLISAAAMENEVDCTASGIATTAQAIASFEDRAGPRLVSHGDIVARRYEVSGARGEAGQGFPHVIDVGLPTLRRRRTQGATEVAARLDTLLSIMSRLGDTCLLYRGGKSRRRGNGERAAGVATPRSPVARFGGVSRRQRGYARSYSISRRCRTETNPDSSRRRLAGEFLWSKLNSTIQQSGG